MNDSVINNLPAHWPMFAVLLVVGSLAMWGTIKVCFSTKASAREKRKEWVLSRQMDAEGIPLLAEDLRRPGGGYPYAGGDKRRSRY
jgi:hypothetical protein